MKRVGAGAPFAEVWGQFCTAGGTARKRLATNAVDPAVRDWLAREQARLEEACRQARAARIAEKTVMALTLARAYGSLYEAAKHQRRGLDFADLIERTHVLLTQKADAAWILFKLDGGIDHMLVDEAQDTAPDQWDILRALDAEFFAGAGAPRRGRGPDRTVFAVGDEKQSIYSFQGAAPERFGLEAEAHRSVVEGAGQRFKRPLLERSFRSAADILAFVDAVFANPDTREGVPPPPGRKAVVHQPHFVTPGCVDLWPLFQETPHEAPEAWDAPLDQEPPESARKRLARAIAEEVAALIARGDQVRAPAGPRPASAGDVLVLVRRRDALFEEIIRALKRAGLPVAGADRLRLSEHIVFQDLLAFGRFVQFPHDDLTLAALLRSPFCDLSEEDLFELAHPRPLGQSLWRALRLRGDEYPAWLDARILLSWAVREAQGAAPFALFGRLLSYLDRDGRTQRQRILTRLGREAEDALDAFLEEVRKAEARGLRDMERLVDALSRAEVQVKRELEAGQGEVRVMTVHGAKGLEAPIVFLPDTTANPQVRTGCLLATDAGGFLWAPRKTEDSDATAAARTQAADSVRRESQRLLYVALTRARDRLVICGRLRADRKAVEEGSWYDLATKAFASAPIAERTRSLPGPEGLDLLRFGADPQGGATLRLVVDHWPEPAWLRGLAPPEPGAARWASPSQIVDMEKGPAPSPLSRTGGLGRFRRGDLIHKLLQLLPDLPSAKRAAAAERLLAKEGDLTDQQRAEMAAAALSVLDDARFAEVFGPGSRAEAAIAGGAPDLPEGLVVSGRVDRLVVTPDRVLVADFKTNRPSPNRIEDADRAYLTQMAVYVAVLRAVFPGRAVEAALVWTDGPKLMPVPENIVAAELARLGRSAN
jgi:ATP-dependent helicase/nuclease subunit A